jgi:putative hydrolase of the HAD superfamily
MTRSFDALLLDIGDVITAPVWDQFDALERAIGRPLVGRGPLDPAGDALWRRHLAGELSYYEYWTQYATLNGYDDWRLLFRELTDRFPENFGDQDAYDLMAEARAAGYKVGVLTNDGVGISGKDFFTTIPEFAALDAFVDARLYGTAKPDPEPYLRAAEALSTDVERVVFLDDAQACIDGAIAVGMTGVLVDPLDKAPAFTTTRRLLGLTG